jgi:SAM-dependent methyltransferase
MMQSLNVAAGAQNPSEEYSGYITEDLTLFRTEDAYCILCGPTVSGFPIASGWDFEYGTVREEHHLEMCSRCGTVYIKDRPAREEMATIYPDNYYSYSESSHNASIVAFMRSRIEASKAERYWQLLGQGERHIVDIGCGDGRLLDILQRQNGEWRLSGIEINKRAAASARSKGYPVALGDFESEEIPWPAGTFDLALLHQVLEHTRNPRNVLKRISLILKVGGYLSIETPDIESLDFHLFKKRYWGGYHIPRHFYLFNKRSLVHLLKEEGFEIVRIESILSPVFWIHSAHNWLVDRKWGRGVARVFNYRNPVLLAAATAIELIGTMIWRRSSNMQIIARKSA